MSWPLTAEEWARLQVWTPLLERECRGAVLLYLVLRGGNVPPQPAMNDLGRRLGCLPGSVTRRLEVLEEHGLVRQVVDPLNRRFVECPALPLAPGESAPPPAALPPRRVRRLRTPEAPAAAAGRPVPRQGLFEPSLRPAWTRWRAKQKTAAHWTPDDFLGYWVCRFKEVYGFEDPDFKVALKLLEGYRHQVRMYISRFLEGDKDRFRDYLTYLFDLVERGDVDRGRPLRWGQVINFRKTGWLAGFQARGKGGGRRGNDQRASDERAWDEVAE